MVSTKKKKAAKKPPGKRKPSRLGVANVKLPPEDRKAIQAKAKKHAQGNFSAWVRAASKRYTPKPGEKIPLTIK